MRAFRKGKRVFVSEITAAQLSGSVCTMQSLQVGGGNIA